MKNNIENNQSIHTFSDDLLGEMDATAISKAIHDKEFTAVEAVKASIERVKKVNPVINAVATEGFDQALKYAQNVKGDLAGVPLFLKDQVNMKGLPTTHGSRSISNKPSTKNDKTVDQILSTGVVVLGKSTTSELGVLPCGETLLCGNTLNPINTGYSTGGSSAGAAALVASGAVPISHAMDGGGSIRIPASCCGLIGLKPTRGRHIESLAKFYPIDFVEQGVVSRSVRDTANYFNAIEKYHRNSRLPSIGKVESPIKERLKIALFTESLSGIHCDREVASASKAAGEFCQKLGHEVALITNPFDIQFKMDFTTFYSYVSFIAKNLGYFNFGLDYKPDKFEPFTKHLANMFPLLIAGNPLTFKRLKKFNDVYESIFDQYDVILNPTLSNPVPKIGYWEPNQDVMAMSDKLLRYANFTIIQNISGAPAISLPMGTCGHGLPIGIQFGAKQGEERKLLELAYEIEAANGFTSFLNEVASKKMMSTNN